MSEGQNDGCCSCLKASDPKCLAIWIRAINFANGLCLMTAGVLSWIFISTFGRDSIVLALLASVYVTLFGAILAVYEMRLEATHICFIANMGFMFDWRGRTLFYIFSGSLCFGLGIWGIVMGSVTMANMLWNLFAICYNPHYSDMLKRDSKAQYERALKREAIRRNVAGGSTMPTLGRQKMKVSSRLSHGSTHLTFAPTENDGFENAEYAMDVAANAPPGVKKAAVDAAIGAAAGWTKRTDEGSGATYWVNDQTGEQTWEKPT
eukprot:1394452-Amorphochlora_amoeboformis.AAC.1